MEIIDDFLDFGKYFFLTRKSQNQNFKNRKCSEISKYSFPPPQKSQQQKNFTNILIIQQQKKTLWTKNMNKKNMTHTHPKNNH